MSKLFIFDLDGTLIDSRKDIALGVNLTLAELGFPAREPDAVYGFIGGGVHNLLRMSLPPGQESLVDSAVEVFWDRYREHLLDSTRAYAGVAGMLDELATRGMLAVATNKPVVHARLALEGLGLSSRFVSIQGWRLGLEVKPDPAILRLAMEAAGAAPGDCVMVGDGMSDILAARAAGLKSCGVGYGYGTKEKLMAGSPDYFADTVEDIIRLLA
ncbi:MAG TPA: HAD-IA family hydrolase [Nitrospirota bacterium]